MRPTRFRWFCDLPPVRDQHRQLHRPGRNFLFDSADRARPRPVADRCGRHSRRLRARLRDHNRHRRLCGRSFRIAQRARDRGGALEPVDRRDRARDWIRGLVRGAGPARHFRGAEFSGAHRRGQPLAGAAGAGDRARQRAGRGAARARNRRSDRDAAAGVVRLARDVSVPVRALDRVGAAVALVFP
jgi:hypothetical protein